jgi:hypothetical protein
VVHALYLKNAEGILNGTGPLNHSLRSGLGHSKRSGFALHLRSEATNGAGYMAQPAMLIFCDWYRATKPFAAFRFRAQQTLGLRPAPEERSDEWCRVHGTAMNHLPDSYLRHDFLLCITFTYF